MLSQLEEVYGKCVIDQITNKYHLEEILEVYLHHQQLEMSGAAEDVLKTFFEKS